MRSSPYVLLTAISVVNGAGASACFRAASMRATMPARDSQEDILADKLLRARLARAAFRFKTRALPALVLMTDDARLEDPLGAARALPRGSLVIVRDRQTSRRAELAAALAAIARRRGLLLIVANDAVLAAKIGADGLHLSEAHAIPIG